jgi:hypothetical protein
MIRFYELLAEAQRRSEEVDMFDLRSDDEADLAKWEILCTGKTNAAADLIRHCLSNGMDLLREMKL